MNLKWLLFILLLLNLPTNTSSQYPIYEWNTTDLGVSIGDIFEFKLTEYSVYNGENDTYTQANIFLNNTSIGAWDKATDDEFLNVGETFSVTIQSNPYFLPRYDRQLQVKEGANYFKIKIPLFNVTVTHNSFVADRVMYPIVSQQMPSIFGILFEGLFLIPDWEIYELIYPNFDYFNETIIDQDNYSIANRSMNFEIGENTIIYDQMSLTNISNSDKPWISTYEKYSTHAIIDKNTGLIKKLEWERQTRAHSPEIDQLKVGYEYLEEESPNFSLGQENYMIFSLTTFGILSVLLIRKKGNKI